MDQFMVDVSHIDGVKVRDDVTLIGQDGDREVTVEEVAAPANSFNYELVCNISRRVPRTYIRDGRAWTGKLSSGLTNNRYCHGQYFF